MYAADFILCHGSARLQAQCREELIQLERSIVEKQAELDAVMPQYNDARGQEGQLNARYMW